MKKRFLKRFYLSISRLGGAVRRNETVMRWSLFPNLPSPSFLTTPLHLSLFPSPPLLPSIPSLFTCSLFLPCSCLSLLHSHLNLPFHLLTSYLIYIYFWIIRDESQLSEPLYCPTKLFFLCFFSFHYSIHLDNTWKEEREAYRISIKSYK